MGPPSPLTPPPSPARQGASFVAVFERRHKANTRVRWARRIALTAACVSATVTRTAVRRAHVVPLSTAMTLGWKRVKKHTALVTWL